MIAACPIDSARLRDLMRDAGLGPAVEVTDLAAIADRAEAKEPIVAIIDAAAWFGAPEPARRRALAARELLTVLLLHHGERAAWDEASLEDAPADILPWAELCPSLLVKAVRHAEAVSRLEARLARQRAENERYSQLYAHHLRGPIGSLQRMLDLSVTRLSTPDAPLDAALDGVSRARDAARRVGALLDGLDRNARALEVAALAYRPLSDAAARAAERVYSEIDAAQRARIDLTPLPTIEHCARQFEAVFAELIKNALTYNNADTPCARIHALSADGADRWIIAVDDNGLGVDPTYAEEIFEPLARLHGPQRFPGSGLGLTLCRGVVEANGGRIWVEASPLGGARIAFALPRRATPSTAPTTANG